MQEEIWLVIVFYLKFISSSKLLNNFCFAMYTKIFNQFFDIVRCLGRGELGFEKSR